CQPPISGYLTGARYLGPQAMASSRPGRPSHNATHSSATTSSDPRITPNPASVEAQTPDAGPGRGPAVTGGGRRGRSAWVVRVYRRTGISVDRLAMHPLDEVAGRERPHARGVPGEAGVVEEVAPLAGRAAAEERGG